MNKRPLSITFIAWLFVIVGVVGLAYHAAEFKAARPLAGAVIWVCFVRLLAIIAGAFMLRGQNWARWLSITWMAWHVVLSAFHPLSELIMHGILLALFAFFLFRPRASVYFRGGSSGRIPNQEIQPKNSL